MQKLHQLEASKASMVDLCCTLWSHGLLSLGSKQAAPAKELLGVILKELTAFMWPPGPNKTGRP